MIDSHLNLTRLQQYCLLVLRLTNLVFDLTTFSSKVINKACMLIQPVTIVFHTRPTSNRVKNITFLKRMIFLDRVTQTACMWLFARKLNRVCPLYSTLPWSFWVIGCIIDIDQNLGFIEGSLTVTSLNIFARASRHRASWPLHTSCIRRCWGAWLFVFILIAISESESWTSSKIWMSTSIRIV